LSAWQTDVANDATIRMVICAAGESTIHLDFT